MLGSGAAFHFSDFALSPNRSETTLIVSRRISIAGSGESGSGGSHA
jgi:hypothetical protein